MISNLNNLITNKLQHNLLNNNLAFRLKIKICKNIHFYSHNKLSNNNILIFSKNYYNSKQNFNISLKKKDRISFLKNDNKAIFQNLSQHFTQNQSQIYEPQFQAKKNPFIDIFHKILWKFQKKYFTKNVDIIKSKSDPRIYKHITLPNELEAILISDPSTDISGASLSVNVGNYADPQNRFGLAHYVEHMLFLGNKKYPQKGEYVDFINKHSGYCNACTSQLTTNFYFTIMSEKFEEALDRYTMNFIAPLFNEKYLISEAESINSEHYKNILNDIWRTCEVIRTSAVDGNVYKNFCTGNKYTLTHSSIRDDLINFFNTYYSSNIMKLCLYGNESINQLHHYAVKYFSKFQNKNVAAPVFREHPFPQSQLGRFYKIYPYQDIDQIFFNFVIDNQRKYYKNNPANILVYLLSQEGQNSLLQMLISKGYAREINVYENEEMRLFSTFNILIQLTKEGVKNYNEVCSILFSYLKMLRSKSSTENERIFNELKGINNISFDFIEKGKPDKFLTEITDRMHDYPPSDILKVPFYSQEFDKELFSKSLNDLNIENLNIYLISQGIKQEALKNEVRYYGAKYDFEAFSSSFKELFNNPTFPKMSNLALDLPQENKFIANNFEVFPLQNPKQKFPIQLPSDQKFDSEICQPKFIFFLDILYYNTNNKLSFEDFNIVSLFFLNVFQEVAREIHYLSSMAGMDVQEDHIANGIRFQFDGFNQTLPNFIKSLMKQFCSIVIENYQNQFDKCYEKTISDLENFYKKEPLEIGTTFKNILLSSDGIELEVLDQKIRQLTFQQFVQNTNELFKNLRLQIFGIGNMLQPDFSALVQEIISFFQTMGNQTPDLLNKKNLYLIQSLQIPTNQTFIYEFNLPKQEPNSGMILYFQSEPKYEVRQSVLNNLLFEVLNSKFFQVIRTQKNLGYNVFLEQDNIRGVEGLKFNIESSSNSPQFLSIQVQEFIEDCEKEICMMTNYEFDLFKQALSQKYNEKDYNLVNESLRYIIEIETNQYKFNKFQEFSDYLMKNIKKQDLIDFYYEMFIAKRRQLEIHLISSNHKIENDELKAHRTQEPSTENLTYIQNVNEFKNQLKQNPDFFQFK